MIIKNPLPSTIIDLKSTIHNAFLSFDRAKSPILFICNENGELVAVVTQGDINRYICRSDTHSLNDNIMKVANKNF